MSSTYTKVIRLRDGVEVLLRPLLPTDTEQLWQLYSTLSHESRGYLGGGFTRERIEMWTSNIDFYRTTPVVVVEELGGGVLSRP